MKKRITLIVGLLLAWVFPTLGNNSNYYFTTTVTATGEGKIYASFDQEDTPEFQESITVGPATQQAQSAPTKTLYLWAEPEEGYKVTFTSQSNAVTITPSETDPNRATARVTGNTSQNTNYQITATFEIKAETSAPVITGSENKSEFWPTLDVTIIAPDEGSVIYYTTDGSDPTNESAVYSAPFTISETTTVKAIAIVEGLDASSVVSKTFTAVKIATERPIISSTDNLKSFWPTLEITITAPVEGAVIYYTTDGTDPTEESDVYTEPFTISETTTVKAIAVVENYFNSSVTTSSFEAVKPSGFITLGATYAPVQVGDEGTVPVSGSSHEGIVWSSSNPEIVEVNAETGAYEVKGGGTAVITADLAEVENFTAATATYTLYVISPKYQIENSGFEEWDDEGTENQEPKHWNSFQHASGSLSNMVKAQQIRQSDDVRADAEGTYSVNVFARSVLGLAIAQGNITTGCINGGSLTATDGKGNYNWTNFADPDFNQMFTGLPDSIHLWVKYSPVNANTKGKVAAKLHTFGYYQDPYENLDLIGETKGVADIEYAVESTLGEWVELMIPVDYLLKDGTRPAFALVSFATSNEPGRGSANDQMWVDDFSFIYNSELTKYVLNEDSIDFVGEEMTIDEYYNSEAIGFVTNGVGATVETSYDEASAVLTIVVKGDNFSEDQENQHTYKLQYKVPTATLAAKMTANDEELAFDEDGKASVNVRYADDLLEFTLSEGASMEQSFDYKTATLTVTVSAKNVEAVPENMKTYEIQFLKPSAEVNSVIYNGAELAFDSNASVSIDGSWKEELLEVQAVDDDADVTISYEEEGVNRVTVRIEASDISEDPDNYKEYYLLLSIATGIDKVRNETTVTLYDLSGRKLDRLPGGKVVIRNGRKVIKKQ